MATAHAPEQHDPRGSLAQPTDPGDLDRARATDGAVCLPLWFQRALVVATAGILGFGGVGLLLAVLGHYSVAPVFAIAAVLTVAATVVAWPRSSDVPASDRARSVSLPAVGMIIVALGFALWNGADAAHHVAIGRDPGVYAVTGKWLSTHGSLEVPTDAHWNSSVPLTEVMSGTYAEGTQRLEFQFNHMMPVLLAEADAVGGDSLLFRVPALLGALALCAVYAFGCRFIRRPWLVLAAVTALGLSLPQLNVSRDTFSESSVEFLLWAGLWLTLTAYQRRRFGLAVLAGAALGGTMLSRVDALIYLIPLPLVAVLGLLAAKSSADRRHLLRMHAAMVIGALPLAALGTLDVIARAGHYYIDLHAQIHQLQLGAIASLVFSAVLLVAWPSVSRRSGGAGVWVADHRQPLAVISAVGLIVGLLAAWILRPAVMHAHGVSTPLVGGLQNLVGLPVDPTRTYGEYSMVWISWYLGPVTLALGVVGAGILGARMWRRADAADVLLLSVAGLISAAYLWSPSITPDQIWAMRRFVPATLPLLVLLAAAAIAVVARLVPTPWSRVVTGLGAVGLMIFPLGVTGPVWRFEPQAGYLVAVKATCATVGPKGAILFAASDPVTALMPTSMRAWCNVPVAIMTKPAAPAALDKLAATWRADGRTLWIVGGSVESISKSAPGVTARFVAGSVSSHELAMTIQQAPQGYAIGTLNIYAGPVLG